MRFTAAIFVLLIWPLAALATPAPLPPGVAASPAKPVTGLYIHVVDRRGGEYQFETCHSGVIDRWFYEVDGRRAVYSRERPCKNAEAGTAAAPPQPVVRSVDPIAGLGEFRPFQAACDPDLPLGKDEVCVDGMVDGVAVRCRDRHRDLHTDRECVSVDRGRTEGMLLDQQSRDDDGARDQHYDVERVDPRAQIDPAVFDTGRPPAAPLPPGVQPSGRPLTPGLFFHGLGDDVGEFWGYQAGDKGEVFVIGSPGAIPSHERRILSADRPFLDPPGSDLGLLRTCERYSGCRYSQPAAGVEATCRVLNHGSTCISVSHGPSRGLIVSWGVSDISEGVSSGTYVDRIIEHALIDPAVFDERP